MDALVGIGSADRGCGVQTVVVADAFDADTGGEVADTGCAHFIGYAGVSGVKDGQRSAGWDVLAAAKNNRCETNDKC